MSNEVDEGRAEDALAARVDELRAAMLGFFQEMKLRQTRSQLAEPMRNLPDVTFNQAFHAWTVQQLAALTLTVEALSAVLATVAKR